MVTPIQKHTTLLHSDQKNQQEQLIVFKTFLQKIGHYKATQRRDALLYWKQNSSNDPFLWLLDLPTLLHSLLKIMMDTEEVVRHYFLHHYLQSAFLQHLPSLHSDHLASPDTRKLLNLEGFEQYPTHQGFVDF